jgi:hypothetical protein
MESSFPKKNRERSTAYLILQLVYVDSGRYWSCGFALGLHTSALILSQKASGALNYRSRSQEDSIHNRGDGTRMPAARGAVVLCVGPSPVYRQAGPQQHLQRASAKAGEHPENSWISFCSLLCEYRFEVVE